MIRWVLALAGVLALGMGAFLLLFDSSVESRPIRGIESLEEPREKPLNVVFILVDMLRADRLSAYGYERDTTPYLSGFAESGVRFANVEAQSTWTKCSMASLWTGIFPPRTGVNRFDHALPAEASMPAEIFKEAGYTTAGIWRNGWVAPNFGFAQGFDLYIRPAQRAEAKVASPKPGTKKLPGTDLDISQAAIEFLRGQGDDPFLLYLHYMDVHQYAYDPTAAELGFGTALSDSYDASIHWTDRNVAWVVNELEALGLHDDTIVIIASDHGEAFNEHGVEGHARNLFRETTQVPLLMLLPFRVADPVVVEPLVRNVDIWPTVLDLAGLQSLPDADGQSLVPLMLAAGRGESPETPVSVAYLDQRWGKTEEEAAPLVSIREHGRGRVAWNTLRPEASFRVYDHTVDPKERNNLRADPPAWTAELRTELEGVLQKPLAFGGETSVEIDEMYEAQLRALGYLVE